MSTSNLRSLSGAGLKSVSALISCLLLVTACGGGSGSGGVTPPVDVNAAPVAVDDAETVKTKSANQFINVLVNDTDADGDTLIITSASIISSSPSVSGGTVAIAPSGGILTYTPPPVFIGQQVIFYTVSDGHGGTDQALATITVSALPVPPLAQADAFVVSANSVGNELDALVNDTDRSGGNSLTLTSVTSLSTVPGGAVSTVGISGNNIQYTPEHGFTGVETLRYTVRDSRGISASGTALITVLPIPEPPPTALPDVATIAMGSSNELIDVIANDVDLAGGGLTLVNVTPLLTVPPGSNGSFSISSNQVSYTPPSTTFVGVQTATYTVEDANGQTATGVLTILVAIGVPELPPLALPDILTIGADTLNNVIAALGNDIDGSGTGLTITDVSVVQTLPSNAGSVVSTDGSNVIFTPPSSYSGVITLQYTVEDGNGATSTAAIIISVLPVALPPVALPDVAAVSQDSAATDIDVLGNDVDLAGGGLSLTDVSVTTSVPAATHTVTISADRVRFTPAAGFAGAVVISYTVTDINGNSSGGVLTMVVSALSLTLPVALPDVVNMTQDDLATDIDVMANDVDLAGGGLTLTAVSVTGSLPTATHVVAINGDQVQFTPEAGFAGAVVVSYTVTDINGDTADGVLSVIVSPLSLELPPVALPDVAIVSSLGGATLIDVLANDVDTAGGGLTLTDASVLLAVPSSPGTITVVSNQVQYTPSLLYAGAVTVTYTVIDINGNTALGELVMTVLP